MERFVLQKNKVKKILIIKLRGIGDVVCSTIVLDNLREEFPNAQIDFLTEKPSSLGLRGLSQINNVLIFDKKSLAERLKLAWKIRKTNYDLVFDFFCNPSSAQITFFSRAKYRIGFPLRGRKYAYNLYGPEERSTWHNAVLHLKVLERFGLETKHQNLLYSLDSKSKSFADKYFDDTFEKNDFVVGICPTGSWASKKCDAEKLAEIAELVIKRFNAKILILWGKGDEADGEKLLGLLKNKTTYAPPTSILEMSALISKCKFLIANDSGPMHISTALCTPVLSIHGPTSPQLQGPFGAKHEWINLPELDCIVCNLLECKRNHECFLNLPIENIMKKIDSLVLKNNLISSKRFR
ncbi:MAG: glycosyl transferase family 9 [Ignavibacteria bacterium]|nr:MAG: glycosyl transferase family 9 [Ignavibacteria bacterium]KAF0162063.1 MAG: glycosyl transferase family 9 [Ignavibacteria bacterium]